jgi:Domain of unknown function (DUF4129)
VLVSILAVPTALGLDVPVNIDRDTAREAARRELAKRVYQDAEPSLPARVIRWVLERLAGLLDRVSEATPGGWYGVVILLAVVALVGYGVLRRLGPIRGSTATHAETSLFGPRRRTAEQHRAEADAAAARGDWATAVRERFRAIVRTLEERGLVDEQPGRTADEAALAGGAMLPESATDLAAAARVFDAVVYGGRPGTGEHDRQLRDLDRTIRSARPLRGRQHMTGAGVGG